MLYCCLNIIANDSSEHMLEQCDKIFFQRLTSISRLFARITTIVSSCSDRDIELLPYSAVSTGESSVPDIAGSFAKCYYIIVSNNPIYRPIDFDRKVDDLQAGARCLRGVSFNQPDLSFSALFAGPFIHGLHQCKEVYLQAATVGLRKLLLAKNENSECFES